MKVRLETSGKIALFVVLGVVAYFGISHFKGKSVNKSVNDSVMAMQDSGSSFSVDTQKTVVVDTVKYVDAVKHEEAKPKHKTVALKQVVKPDVKAEPKHKTEDRSNLEISNY
jgi:hypothetical protein